MSFDPFNQQQPPPEPEQPPGYSAVPSGNPFAPAQASVPPAGATPMPSLTMARDRILFPAVLLFVTGVVNLLFGVFCGFGAVVYSSMNPAQLEQAMAQNPMGTKNLEDLKEQGYTLEGILSAFVTMFSVGTGLNVLSALLTIVAGVRLLQLRSYGFVLFAAILAAIPGLSGSACCCLGEVAGLYAIVMLLQTDIRDAFR